MTNTVRYVCRCGNTVRDSVAPPADCQGCTKCGSTLAENPGEWTERVDHDIDTMIDWRDGETLHERCTRPGCHYKKHHEARRPS